MGASGHFASHTYIECPARRFVPGSVIPTEFRSNAVTVYLRLLCKVGVMLSLPTQQRSNAARSFPLKSISVPNLLRAAFS